MFCLYRSADVEEQQRDAGQGAPVGEAAEPELPPRRAAPVA